jgi:hypothetical protein
MENPMGESNSEVLRLDFDRRLMLQFRGRFWLARIRLTNPVVQAKNILRQIAGLAPKVPLSGEARMR